LYLLQQRVVQLAHQFAGLQGDGHLPLQVLRAGVHQEVQAAVFLLQVLEIEDVDGQKYHDAPRIIQNDDTRYIRGIINDKNRLIIMIEHTELIPREDQENMKEIINE